MDAAKGYSLKIGFVLMMSLSDPVRKLNSTKGMVYATAVAMVIIFMAMGVAYLEVGKEESYISVSQLNGMKAFYAAEAGIQHGIAELHNGANFRGIEDFAPVNSIGNVMDNASPFIMDNDNNGINDYVVTWGGTMMISQGTYRIAKRKIMVSLLVSGTGNDITINEWRGHYQP